MSDLTVVFLTAQKMPTRWEKFHRVHLLAAVEDRPMIVSSIEPMDLGRPNTEYIIQDGPFCAWSVYRQMLRAARIATTKYLGIAENDSLYPRRHFSDFRPPDDAVAYDFSRWSIFSWKGEQAFYSAIRKHGNFTMIGPRKLVVEALEEREAKYPNGTMPIHGRDLAGEIGRPDIEKGLGVKRNKLVEWYCIDASINLCHERGLSPTYVNTRGVERKPGEMKALEVPYWGRAADIAAIYNLGVAEEAEARP